MVFSLSVQNPLSLCSDGASDIQRDRERQAPQATFSENECDQQTLSSSFWGIFFPLEEMVLDFKRSGKREPNLKNKQTRFKGE